MMEKLMMVFALTLAFAVQAAPPQFFSYSGTLSDTGGAPIEGNVTFIIEVMPPAEDCALYRESHILDMTGKGGHFNLDIGAGDATTNPAATSDLAMALSNDGSVLCGTFSPVDGDTRRVRVKVDDGTDVATLSPDIRLSSVPSAMHALNSETVGGMEPAELLQVSADTDQAKLDNVFGSANYTELQALLDGSSSHFDIPSGAIIDDNVMDVSVSKLTSAAGEYLTYEPNGTPCTSNQVLKFDGTNWICADDLTAGAGSVTNSDLAADAVTADKISDGTIDTADLAADAVTSALILDGTIVDADISGLDASKLTGTLPALDGSNLTNLSAPPGANSVNSATIVDGSIGDVDIAGLDASKLSGTLPALDGFNLTNLAAGAIGVDSIDSAKIVDGSIGDVDIAGLDASKLSGTLPALDGFNLTNLAAGAIGADSIDSAKIVDGSIGDVDIAGLDAGKLTGVLPALDASNLTNLTAPPGADSVNSATIVDGSIGDVDIAGLDAGKLTGVLPAIDGSNLTNISAGAIGADSVDSSKIVDGSVGDVDISGLDASKLSGTLPALDGFNLTNISAAAIGPDSVDGAKIVDGSVGDVDISGLDASKLSGTLPALDGFNLTNISAAAIGPDSIDGAKIVDGSVGDVDISGLDASKLSGTLPALDGYNLTNLAAAAIGPDSVDGAKIVDGSVGDVDISGLDASKLSGTLPALDGFNLTNISAAAIGPDSVDGAKVVDGSIGDVDISGLDASKLSGTLPALDGFNLTNLPASGFTDYFAGTVNADNTGGYSIDGTNGNTVRYDIDNGGVDQGIIFDSPPTNLSTGTLYTILVKNISPGQRRVEFNHTGYEFSDPGATELYIENGKYVAVQFLATSATELKYVSTNLNGGDDDSEDDANGLTLDHNLAINGSSSKKIRRQFSSAGGSNTVIFDPPTGLTVLDEYEVFIENDTGNDMTLDFSADEYQFGSNDDTFLTLAMGGKAHFKFKAISATDLAVISKEFSNPVLVEEYPSVSGLITPAYHVYHNRFSINGNLDLQRVHGLSRGAMYTFEIENPTGTDYNVMFADPGYMDDQGNPRPNETIPAGESRHFEFVAVSIDELEEAKHGNDMNDHGLTDEIFNYALQVMRGGQSFFERRFDAGLVYSFENGTHIGLSVTNGTEPDGQGPHHDMTSGLTNQVTAIPPDHAAFGSGGGQSFDPGTSKLTLSGMDNAAQWNESLPQGFEVSFEMGPRDTSSSFGISLDGASCTLTANECGYGAPGNQNFLKFSVNGGVHIHDNTSFPLEVDNIGPVNPGDRVTIRHTGGTQTIKIIVNDVEKYTSPASYSNANYNFWMSVNMTAMSAEYKQISAKTGVDPTLYFSTGPHNISGGDIQEMDVFIVVQDHGAVLSGGSFDGVVSITEDGGADTVSIMNMMEMGSGIKMYHGSVMTSASGSGSGAVNLQLNNSGLPTSYPISILAIGMKVKNN